MLASTKSQMEKNQLSAPYLCMAAPSYFRMHVGLGVAGRFGFNVGLNFYAHKTPHLR